MRSNMTGIGFNNSEYRSFNRGFGRGYSKPYRKPQRPSSPQPTRKGDVFIEAGKLAVEYLVSHGLLSSNVVAGKWQNGTLRNNARELKDHCNTQDKELSSSPIKEHAVAVGNSKSQSDDDLCMDRNLSRERKQPGVSRSYSSDFSQETGKDPDDYNGPKDISKDPDTDVQMSHSVESSAKDDRDKNLMNEMKKNHMDVDSDLKMASMPQAKDDSELEKHADVVDTGHEETKDGTGEVESEKETSMDELVIKQCEDKHDFVNNNTADLLKLCGADKIPTKIRSSLVAKRPKGDRDFISNEENTNDTGCDSVETTKAMIINCSSDIPSSVEIPSSNCVTTALSGPSFGNVGVPDTSYDVNQQKSSNEPPELKRVSSSDNDRGEKRGLIEHNIGEGVKRAKQWLSVSQSGDYTQLSDVTEKPSIFPDRPVTGNFFNGNNQETFANVSLPLKGGVGSSVDQGEKQFFSSSFRICDLNLMGSSDIHENRDIPSLLYPSISASSKDAPVGIDLTMNSSSSLNDMFNNSGSARKGIEIIDLESESQSLQDAKTTPASMEVGMTNVVNFPNNSQNANDNPDSQNGYSFMISELLGNDVPNCSSVQPDMNSLQNDMGLHQGEVMFAEDDSIYMSLGEIPISLLRAWEQANQERNPFGL